MSEPDSTIDDLDSSIHYSSISYIALSSAIFAALAAITAMLSNFHSNEAVIDQIQASSQWGYYQAKGIKGNMVANKIDLLLAFGRAATQSDQDQITQYKKDQNEISENAREKERSSALHMRKQIILARGISLFQLAIAISAIAIMTRRRTFWHLSLLSACGGLFFLVQGLLLTS
jgi:hypothetical protein